MTAPKRIVLGVSAGIAAYKTPDLVRLLRKQDIEVRVALTPAAAALVGEEALRTVSGGPVYRDGAPAVYDMDHIRLAEWADWMLVCPATANTIAKLAHGIADNLLTTLALCFERRLALVPAMNSAMWAHAATQRNVETIKARGDLVLPVAEGELACGTWGAGRMIPLDTIVEYVAGLGQPPVLSGKRILIASGPTEEPLDPVRVITNRSSGRMGAALAAVARTMGAEVTVVSGPAVVALPWGVKRIDVRTAAEMQAALNAEFGSCDACIMAAAVSDYRPVKVESAKMKRVEGGEVSIRLAPNPDILAGLGAAKDKQVLVGFSLESPGDSARAAEKMARKKCDLMVLNYVDSSLGLATAEATILYTDREPEPLAAMDKAALARCILTRIAQRMELTDV
jgi:phosphopantothenoylcysteine decarboxylase / phosphopantothenate---cysteine ligase